MNPHAKHPNLPPRGPADADLYVIGTWPSPAEDLQGKVWSHREAAPVRKFASTARVRYSHVVRTLPKGDKPLEHEVLAFRRETTEDIEATQPRVILACGNLAFQFFQPKIASQMKSNMHIHRGRKFPVRVGRHTCWMVPTFSMVEYKLMSEKGDKVCRDPKQWRQYLDDDIQLAFELSKSREKPFVEVHDAQRILDQAGARLLYNPQEILDALEDLIRDVDENDGILAYDYETQELRPYLPGARVDSLAIHTYKHTIAFPVEHPRIEWTVSQYKYFKDCWRKVLSLYECIAHGQEFETEWDMHLLGRAAARVPKRRHCSMTQAYVLSSRVGRAKGGDNDDDRGVAGLSLDYLCRLHQGLPLKALSDAKLWKERDALPDLLKYDAMDAIKTFEIFCTQEEELRAAGLESAYDKQMRRIPTVVISQWDGVPVVQSVVAELSDKYQDRIDEATANLNKLDEIEEFKRRFGRPFNPNSDRDTPLLFNEILDQKLGSAQEAAIAKFKHVEFSAKYILEYKKAKKLISTYVNPFDIRSAKHHIMPDGLVHCRYHTIRVETGRVSSSEPNLTNLPDRGEGKDTKRAMVAPPGYIWTAFDYGQIEARVFVFESRDKTFKKHLWNGYDVHMEWAEKLARLFPEIIRRYDGDMDKWRSAAKNQVVFPWFFGAGLESVARSIKVEPYELRPVREEFQQTFSGIFAWHKKISKFFAKNGYVQTLSGLRRYGPMSFNAQTNMPIQGFAAEICFNAWSRLSEYAMKHDLPWLSPRMMVHDDLKFLHPISETDTIMDIVPRVMCVVPYSAAKIVPIVVEASQGPNLADMPKLGEYSSEQYQ